ncbi:Os04g0682400 [Oryza sativa Japonica Group]|uniref:Os04g0682400 protein n=2 Tax=Oryza sativa subsp. japonica TaxID=39947 RepID=A0A0P0WGS4_ORYSJ|nr:Os04g0682400 [Oryza sativa Japonica Group]
MNPFPHAAAALDPSSVLNAQYKHTHTEGEGDAGSPPNHHHHLHHLLSSRDCYCSTHCLALLSPSSNFPLSFYSPPGSNPARCNKPGILNLFFVNQLQAQLRGGKVTLAAQQEGFSDKMNSGAEYEDGSEEEEPYERVFYDDEDDGNDDSICGDPCDDSVPKEEVHRKLMHEAEPYDDLVAGEEESVENSALQAFKKERNEQELKQAQKMGYSIKQKEIPVDMEMGMKPFKKRLVKFADDVSCYTYSTESFAAAKLEKRKAQFDDQDKHLHKKQEHTPPSFPQDGGKLKEVDNTNLYVGNLPASVGSHKLIELFLPFGQIVRSRVVDDCFTGLSQGYGFVKYSDPRCASEAIKRMNGRLVEGRALEVRVAGFPSSEDNSQQPSKETDMAKLYVCNLSLSMNTDRLIHLFLPFGEVTNAKVAKDHTTGLSKGYGFVQYSSPHHAAEAVIHLNGRLVDGRKIEVRVSGIPSTLPNSAVESPSTTRNSAVESPSTTRTVKEIDMSNLYVCNMPSSIDTKKLVELFLPFGKITHARVVADPDTFSAKGYGFIKFTDSESATKAIAAMNGALVGGEMIIVRVAGLSPSASISAVQTTQDINKSRLYITNLPRSMTADKMVNLFAPFGQITKVLMNLEYSLVWYADAPSATKAVQHMDGYMVEGKRLVVKRSELCTTNASQAGGKPIKEIDMANLYVGRVPSSLTEDQFIDLFRPFGRVVQARMFRFQRYGMVRFDNPSCAAAAIDHLDGYQIGGSILAVRVAGLPAESNAAKGALTSQMSSNEQGQIDMTNLYVSHLPSYVNNERLIDLFLPCGQITQAKVVVERYTGVSKGFGFVKFADAYSAAVALTHMNGYPLDGHVLEVRIAGVHPDAMSSYMAHFYSHFTMHDPAKAAVGIPTSYWPHYYDESAYNTTAENLGQVTTTSATDASAAQTSQKERLPGSKSVDLVAEKDCSSASNKVANCSESQPTAWAGPPGFEPHAISKKCTAGSNASQACSKDHFAQSGGGHKRRSIV